MLETAFCGSVEHCRLDLAVGKPSKVGLTVPDRCARGNELAEKAVSLTLDEREVEKRGEFCRLC
jgi:hypothetical protein